MLAADTRLSAGLARAQSAAAWLAAVRPVVLLAPLCVVQVLIGAWFAWRTPHNGWIWYSGGDATEYWTSQWSLAHGFLPRGVISYGVPVFLAWVPLVAGQTLLQGAAVIGPLQLVLLVPAALVCFWGVADRLFGRVFAWWAAVLWVLAPLLMLRGFRSDYHQAFDQYFLVPHWYGLTNMADLPSMVAVLASTWATLWAVERRALAPAVLGGVLGGLAVGIKPANGFFLVAVAVLFALTRRWRVALAWGLALAPAVLTLALWKARGLGSLPISNAAGGGVRLAAGGGAVGANVGFVHLGKYVGFDHHHLHAQLADLREVFWSLRLLEYLAVAGIVGAIRRAPAKGIFLAVWFAGFCIVKTSNTGDSQIPSATFFRIAQPGLPAYVLLVASIVFLVPRIGRRWAAPAEPAADTGIRRADLRWLAPAVAVVALIPLVLVAAVPAATSMRTVRDENVVQEAPLSDAFHLTAVRRPDGSIRVSWRRPPSGSTQPWFVLERSPTDACVRPESGSNQCIFNLPLTTVATTQATSVVDRPGTGSVWYWVALVADYRRSTQGGDLMLLSHGLQVPAS